MPVGPDSGQAGVEPGQRDFSTSSEWRVVFLHIRHGTKFEVLVSAPTQYLATRAGGEQLEIHMRRTAGHVSDWGHYSTAEVLP